MPFYGSEPLVTETNGALHVGGGIRPKSFFEEAYRVNWGVGWEGLEPSTNALKGHCSTIELPTRNVENESGEWP